MNKNNQWHHACQKLETQGSAYCLATILSKSGSVPGETGAKMVITANEEFGSLGGGKLEFDVINKARKELTSSEIKIGSEGFMLDNKHGQACGGSLKVLFEYRNINQPKVVIFGAGHVCQSLCLILSQLPCSVTVVDSRKEWLDKLEPLNIITRHSEQPESIISELSEHTSILVMTHEHQLDFKVVQYALERNCFSYVGLIGSKSKRKQAERYLNEHLSAPELLSQLTCPIGHPDIKGKLPMQIAVSVSAQLISRFTSS
ncbi:xanthine dehydrogenase accessory protein XdhC [Vibrio sp. JC009]|uniref:xanthine dehydrogenase accessory protein XdhC n=1 Tax=Vibrio sp. JC009 TaxID=2912314 RepID=UPI0023B06877|nr:xanthine dehydrogenase accessory protein XdhC [Vibrio sp. JC009]WED22879.1 xanthine dehydrogenase accessory protein XdhC [Vibrio sp. JC009]